MHNSLKSAITPQHLTYWRNHFVTAAAPFYFPDSKRYLLPTESIILTRSEFALQQSNLSISDSYATSLVDQHCTSVVALDDPALRSITLKKRQALLYTQWQHKRGQVYVYDHIQYLLNHTPDTIIAPYCVETEMGKALILDAVIWNALSDVAQIQWLHEYVAAQQASYPWVDRQTFLSNWPATPTASAIHSLANTFSWSSGPNCFGTTVAAITADVAVARSISTIWLHQEPFLREIKRRGYTNQHDYNPESPITDDAVYVWQDNEGKLQHACYIIAHGVAINKNSQAWYDPRHLAAINDIVRYWEEDNFTIAIYTK